ncbi:hypothetical protein HGH92_24510 [Chitinophaga varians]|uniref:Uncharacterized protein n=1 Tax=Chitinophaga varians TaxID=2202339 RepID=A0A847RP26_9BACT|nr:hypothetical protein [Chitinophaga varians]NLR67490.1 hypothetical protein [Chitinophaga varians]
MKIIFILFSLLAFITSSAQVDTLVVREKRGFLFLSASNYMYDYDGRQNEIRLLGFHDFFFPADRNFDELDSLIVKPVLKDGLRVDFFEKRQAIKKEALEVFCSDTTGCYGFEKFYIIPVVVTYKQYKDFEPLICNRPVYELLVDNKHLLRFEYLSQAITISFIQENQVLTIGKGKVGIGRGK